MFVSWQMLTKLIKCAKKSSPSVLLTQQASTTHKRHRCEHETSDSTSHDYDHHHRRSKYLKNASMLL